jgi:hypothetical protein
MMKFNLEDVNQAVKAIDDLCLKCIRECDTCYVAIAKRSIATLKKNENLKN